MEIFRLIYCSVASDEFCPKSLLDIAIVAERNNTLAEVTGALAFGNHRFLQMLEGTRRSLSRTFGKIINDTRHQDVLLLDFSPSMSRLFPEWSMKILEIEESVDSRVRKLVHRYGTSTTFEPEHFSAQQAAEFLVELSSFSADLTDTPHALA